MAALREILAALREIESQHEVVDKNGNSRMVDSANSSETVGNAEGDRKALGSRLIKLSILFLVVQLTVDWSANILFSSNVGISGSIYSSFARWDEITPALLQLKVFYRAPVHGREFSQIFAIYFFLLCLLCLYAIGLFALLLSRRYREFWRQMAARDYAIVIFISAFGFWEIYDFLVGPSSLKNYHGIFGRDFLTSVCFCLPTAQFLILSVLALFYAVGGNAAQKS